jgi:membrane-bound lytic murein transglycosylase MltF
MSRVRPFPIWAALGSFAALIGCSEAEQETGQAPAPPPATAAEAPPVPKSEATPPASEKVEPAPEPTELPTDLAPFLKAWTGDLDGMLERRLIRVLTVSNPVLYYVDRGREVGITYEMAQDLETELNAKRPRGAPKVYVLLLPVRRDELLPRLIAGEGDIAAAQLTITAERREQVDFSQPFYRNVSEIVVTGPSAKPVRTLDDLSGLELYVRPSSSYAEHLRGLNADLTAKGLAPAVMVPADETLEDGDILEMVGAGLVGATIVDDVMATLWADVLPGLTLHPDVAVHRGGDIAVAMRKDTPRLAAMMNEFAKSRKQGTLKGNVLINKYLKSTEWVKNARSETDIARFRQMVDLFRKYSDQYDFDWLLMAAQGYQESGLDQKRRSHVGAIGVMQVMPATARDKAVNIPDIEVLESNIHAGIKYNRWVADTYFDDPDIDGLNRAFFVFASYNAGPNRIARLRKEAQQQGLDPNRWFSHVETVVAKRVGREPVQYVANIYKYYLAYQMLATQEPASRSAAAEWGPIRGR